MNRRRDAGRRGTGKGGGVEKNFFFYFSAVSKCLMWQILIETYKNEVEQRRCKKINFFLTFPWKMTQIRPRFAAGCVIKRFPNHSRSGLKILKNFPGCKKKNGGKKMVGLKGRGKKSFFFLFSYAVFLYFFFSC